MLLSVPLVMRIIESALIVHIQVYLHYVLIILVVAVEREGVVFLHLLLRHLLLAVLGLSLLLLLSLRSAIVIHCNCCVQTRVIQVLTMS